ncbi:MAG: transporter substrate-binding domain-containing protein [Granulosicoccus sp.]
MNIRRKLSNCIVLMSALCISTAALFVGANADDCSNCGVRGDEAAEELQTIRVGIRSDAKPFSYYGYTDSRENILPNYRGYMVRICRRVLREMTTTGPFKGYKVEAVDLLARERFDALDNRRVNMLCGPDSITSSRMRSLNVSHPLFLSGITYGYVDPDSGLFPRKEYCGPVVGVLQGTTAAINGLVELAEKNLLLRFDEPLEAYLANTPARLRAYEKAEIGIRNNPEYATQTTQQIWHLLEPEYREIQKKIAQDIVTSECPDGYSALPVRNYFTHDEGIAAFCQGKVLYYVGDYDIIHQKVDEYLDCPVVMERFTSTREVYGAFFRKGFNDDYHPDGGIQQLDNRSTEDLLLYTVFNHTLLSMMQDEVSILEYEYEKEFGDREMSEDLKQFFRSFKIASDG